LTVPTEEQAGSIEEQTDPIGKQMGSTEQTANKVRETDVGTRPAWRSRTALGTMLGLTSALGYTLSNIFLRSVTHCDPIWVSCVKAVPTVVLLLPWIMWRIVKRETIVRSKGDLAIILAAGAFAQIGNVSFQWSLGVIGLALAVPFTLGTLILGGVAWGHWLLGEVVTARTLFALGLVVGSICILSLGAGEAHRSIQRATAPVGQIVKVEQIVEVEQNVEADATANTLVVVTIGILFVCLAGFTYSTLGAAIRWVRNHGTPLPSILFFSCLVGVVSLAAICLERNGFDEMLQTTRRDWNVMLLAGFFNAIAFAALAAAMHLSGLVYVNALNASQTAMASLAGVFFFGEAVTAPLAIGVPLTIVGLLLMKSTRGK
jgi:drug/metabolite transporter (DMT)-like permease